MEPWTELRTATIVGKLGTVSAAAEFLGVHRATVIRHLDVLESFLGSRLFLRHAKGYALTESGRKVVETGIWLEAQFSDMAGRVRGGAELVTGELVITSVSALASLLMPSVAKYCAEFPGSEVRFVATSELADFGYGEAHVAVRGGSKPENPDYVVLPILDLIPTAQKVDTFLAVLCLTPVRPWRTAPAGPSFTTGAAFAAMPCSALFLPRTFPAPYGLGVRFRGQQSRPLYQRIQESFSVAAGIREPGPAVS